MFNREFVSAFALSILSAGITFASPGFVPPSPGVIGNNLEAFTRIELTEPAPPDGLVVTITSDEPLRLLVAASNNEAGSRTLTLKVPARHAQTDDFYLQALGGPGTATYTVSAPGYQTVKGTIKIARSAALIGGPSKALVFRTTAGTPRPILAYTAVLDDAGNVLDEQPVAGGLTVKVDIGTSDSKVGVISASPLIIKGGEISAMTEFKPVGSGKAILTPSVPSGFQAAAKPIEITVNLPGIALTGSINLGKNLEVLGNVLLGENAPPGGLDVTLTSEDPKKLILSMNQDEVGSETITLHIPAGEGKATYYIQALADSGTVNYTAVAKGYHTVPSPITLAPSGVMVVFAPYGPPDEGEYLSPMPRPNERTFFTSLSEHKPLWLTIWSVYLDPNTHRGADITAQRLRPGLSLKVDLSNTNPAVAKVPSSVTLTSKTLCGFAEFQPLHPGETVLSVNTPPDFVTPSNATSVKATVAD